MLLADTIPSCRARCLSFLRPSARKERSANLLYPSAHNTDCYKSLQTSHAPWPIRPTSECASISVSSRTRAARLLLLLSSRSDSLVVEVSIWSSREFLKRESLRAWGISERAPASRRARAGLTIVSRISGFESSLKSGRNLRRRTRGHRRVGESGMEGRGREGDVGRSCGSD